MFFAKFRAVADKKQSNPVAHVTSVEEVCGSGLNTTGLVPFYFRHTLVESWSRQR